MTLLEHETPLRVKPSPFDFNAAKFLAKKMKEQRLIRGMPNVGKWADEFRRLRRTFAEDEIKPVLIWFCHHVKDDFVPKVFCAAEFCRRFPQIQMAMQRGTDRWDDLPNVEVTDDAVKVSRNLGGLIWPKDEKQDELKVIQASLNNYRDWLNRLRVAKVRRPDQAGLIDCLLALGGDPIGFVESWFARLHRSAWEVEGWAGKLGRHVVKTDSPKFRKIVNGWLQEYLGQGEHWERLETLLKKGDRR
jgi:hypothetical protein